MPNIIRVDGSGLLLACRDDDEDDDDELLKGTVLKELNPLAARLNGAVIGNRLKFFGTAPGPHPARNKRPLLNRNKFLCFRNFLISQLREESEVHDPETADTFNGQFVAYY